MKDYETRAKYVCERPQGAFEQIDNLLEQINNPRPRMDAAIENLVLEPMIEGGKTYDELTEESRREAMVINRIALQAIYKRYKVDKSQSKHVQHLGDFRSPVAKPLSFMGVQAMGYTGGNLTARTESTHFSDYGIGLLVQHEYSKRGNPGLAIKTTDDPLEPHEVTRGYSLNAHNREEAVPSLFRLAIHEVVNGQLVGGGFSY